MATTASLKNEMATKKQGEVAKQQPTTMAGWVKAYEKQIAKALPSVLTPERFSRMVTTALTQTPKLAECTPNSFIGAMLTAAQLGLEPNTPLGQAYLIPYGNQCQFQIGYKGLIDLANRSGEIKNIEAHIVYENDEFDFEFGLDGRLKHKPAKTNKGEMIWAYALYRLVNGGYGFEVMSVDEIKAHGNKYSKTYKNGPWQTNFEEMAKKTVLKKVLKYAPLRSDFIKGAMIDETTQSVDFSAENEESSPVIHTTSYTIDEETGEVNGDLSDLTGTPFDGGNK